MTNYSKLKQDFIFGLRNTMVILVFKFAGNVVILYILIANLGGVYKHNLGIFG